MMVELQWGRRSMTTDRTAAEAAREPFIGLLHEEYPQHRVYVNAIFAQVKQKPRFAEEHDLIARWQPVCKVAPNDYLSVKGER